MNRVETISSSIDAIANQIQLLSNKCILEENRINKSAGFEKTLEASALMLQLSRTMGELILIERSLEKASDKPVNPNDVMGFLTGGGLKL